MTKKVFVFANNAKHKLNVNPTILHDLKIKWFVKDNMKDSDNVFFATKFLLDGMVMAKLINTDSRKGIRHISHEIYTDKNDRIEVELIEA